MGCADTGCSKNRYVSEYLNQLIESETVNRVKINSNKRRYFYAFIEPILDDDTSFAYRRPFHGPRLIGMIGGCSCFGVY